MDFYKLTNFQLYALINSRHLNTADKAAAEQELQKRGLTTEELKKLADELASRQHYPKWSVKIDSTVLWLVLIVVALIFIRQMSCR